MWKNRQSVSPHSTFISCILREQHIKLWHTFLSWVEFEPKIPVFDLRKLSHFETISTLLCSQVKYQISVITSSLKIIYTFIRSFPKFDFIGCPCWVGFRKFWLVLYAVSVGWRCGEELSTPFHCRNWIQRYRQSLHADACVISPPDPRIKTKIWRAFEWCCAEDSRSVWYWIKVNSCL